MLNLSYSQVPQESHLPRKQMILLDQKQQSSLPKRVCVEPEHEANFDEYSNSASGDADELFSDIQIDEHISECNNNWNTKDDSEDDGYHDKSDSPEHCDENQSDEGDDDDECEDEDEDEEFNDETDGGDDQGASFYFYLSINNACLVDKNLLKNNIFKI